MANNTLLASDNFASGSLAAGWSAFSGFSVCQVVAGSPNVTEGNTLGTSAGQRWTGLTWPNDQISEVTVQNLSATLGILFLAVRMQPSLFSGYVVQINNNSAALDVYTNGTPTAIGSTVTGLTFAAGDVWTLQVVGSVLSLYQNGTRVLYRVDTTYTSGTPGYLQQAISGSLTNSQVSSWRGYSAVQQDGIWKKQGSVIPAIAGDYSSGAGGVSTTSMILYEGGSQLGLGAGSVYKMWFESIFPGTLGNIWYAESLDGINWTRSASAVITNKSFPQVLKVGSTYYLYCQTFAANNVWLYTSTDGINWSIQNSGNPVFTLGAGGQFDATAIYGFCPVTIIAGTWYALYTGAAATTFLGKIGLATSSDGINWSRSASNPVFSGAYNTSAIVNVGGTWYMWANANQPGLGATAVNLLDPTENIRIQTTDFIHWTGQVNSIHHGQMFEDVNGTAGQANANTIINIGGKAYMYMGFSASDAVAPSVYGISLAIAPASIAQIITQKEDAVQQVASDAFTSGAGSLSANWTTPTGGTALQIVGTGPFLAEPTVAATWCQAVYTGKSFSPNQYSEVTIATLGAGNYTSPLLRCSTTSLNWYECFIQGATGSAVVNCRIATQLAGVENTISPSVQITTQVGDVFRFQVITGTDGFPVLSLFQNGFLILQYEDEKNLVTSGNPGFRNFVAALPLSGSQTSLWAGGNANVIPAYPSGASSSWLTVAEINSLRGLKH